MIYVENQVSVICKINGPTAVIDNLRVQRIKRSNVIIPVFIMNLRLIDDYVGNILGTDRRLSFWAKSHFLFCVH